MLSKTQRLMRVLTSLCAASLLAFAATNALAFHSSSELICQKCHTMHYSEDGAAPTQGTGGPNKHLLYKKNVTDLCLMCHSDAANAPDVYDTTTDLPGGDFLDSDTTPANGHNPYGDDTNISATINKDTTLALTPPGGSGALTEFTCATCHGPHGGANECFPYRNLGNDSHETAFPANSIESTNTEEANIWNGSANQAAETATNHNVYKLATGSLESDAKGFGAWCGKCHTNFHGAANTKSGVDWIRHPTNAKLTTTVSYQDAAYNPAYPVETSNTTASTTSNWTISAQTEHQVMCLSCHKAHASGNANAGRWDFAAASGTNTGCNFCHHKGG